MPAKKKDTVVDESAKAAGKGGRGKSTHKISCID